MSKTKLSPEDIEKIINLYQTTIKSTHKLSELFNVGHKKITEILKSHNISINKKGAQQQNLNSEIITLNKTLLYNNPDNKKLVAVCKKTRREFNDVNNLSGILTDHILKLYPNAHIPENSYQRKKYEYTYKRKWFEEYFNIIEKDSIDTPTRKCKICDWETKDVTNKTGCFEIHIKNEHNLSIGDYLNNYPEDIIFHPKYQKKIDREKLFSNSNNFAVCRICGLEMKVISNTHLRNKHNLTSKQYKLLYPNEKLSSLKSTEIFRRNAIIGNINVEPTWTSSGEIEIMKFIEELGFDIKKGRNRTLLMGKEIDLIVESKKLCIEYNGLYYHTEKMGKNSMYHLNKTIDCNNIGYGLIHIFEDEWVTKKELVKNKIKHILGVGGAIKIGARNVEIRKILSKEKSEFLNKNHIQGNDSSIIYYGAFYKNEIVGVMSFKYNRNMTKNKNNQYELSRFATKDIYSVRGLGSKFIKHFIREYSPKSIISFADRRWTINSSNNLYTKMGFKLVDIIKPSYYYYNSKIDKYKRYHKFGFGKTSLKKRYPNMDFNKTEKELTSELGYSRIWDCGLFKYELKISGN